MRHLALGDLAHRVCDVPRQRTSRRHGPRTPRRPANDGGVRLGQDAQSVDWAKCRVSERERGGGSAWLTRMPARLHSLMSQLLAWERVLSREHGSGVTDRIEEASMGPEPDRLWREAQGEAARVEAAALDLRMIQNQA